MISTDLSMMTETGDYEKKRRIIIYSPSSIFIFIFLILIFIPIFFLLGAGLVTFGFHKLGLTLGQTLMMFLFSLLGSFINIPIRRRDVVVEEKYEVPRLIQWVIGLPPYSVKKQILCVNVGGAIIPLAVSLYVALMIPPVQLMISIGLMTVISKLLSKVIKGVGVVLPGLVPPFISAMLAFILNPYNPAALAYVTGVVGTLVGADVLNLNKLKDSPGVISIGGAGIFDGIFLTGVFAALLS